MKNIMNKIEDLLNQENVEEYLNNDVPIEALYRNALQEIKRLKKQLAFRDGENITLLEEVKYLQRELDAIKKKDYEKRHIAYKAEISSMNQIIANYKSKIKKLEEEVFNLKEVNFQQCKDIEKMNLEETFLVGLFIQQHRVCKINCVTQ